MVLDARRATLVMLLTPLRYVFYRILAWKLREQRESLPVLVAVGITVILLFYNLLAIVMIVNRLRGKSLIPDLPGGRIGLGISLVLSLAIAYLAMRSAWVENRGRVELEKFLARGTRGDPVRSLLFWTYIVVTMVAPFLLSILWRSETGHNPYTY